jgi:hypothetical protein
MLRRVLLLLCLAANSGTALAGDCSPRLWPATLPWPTLDGALRDALLYAAGAIMAMPPHPIATLASAGIIDPDDPQRVATRTALRDANHAALLALAFRLDGERDFLDATRRLLIGWAGFNRPSGHPVDESKLDLFIWAYDLVRCDIPQGEQKTVEAWLRAILDRKDRWRFGPSASRNNQHTHQLKVQVLIAAALDDAARLKRYTAQAREHAAANIEPDSGATYDFRERDALHYHVYDLEAWGEIDLVTRCCTASTDAAAMFLWRKIAGGDVDHQFAASRQPIDRRRADAGHTYLAQHYDIRRAARAAVVLTTGRCNNPNLPFAHALIAAPPRPELLFFLIRRNLWNTSLGC